jgi:hypothetical protein
MGNTSLDKFFPLLFIRIWWKLPENNEKNHDFPANPRRTDFFQVIKHNRGVKKC